MKFKNDKHQDVNDIPREIVNRAFKNIDEYLQKYLDIQFNRLIFVRNEKYQRSVAEIFVLRQLDETLKECQKN